MDGCLRIGAEQRHTGGTEDNGLDAGEIRGFADRFHGMLMIQGIYGFHGGDADTAENIFNADLFHNLVHHGFPGSGMGLMSGHGGSGVIEDDQGKFRLVVDGVHHARKGRGEEG